MFEGFVYGTGQHPHISSSFCIGRGVDQTKQPGCHLTLVSHYSLDPTRDIDLYRLLGNGSIC